MYRVAMVCEGPTDQVIIEAILDSYMDDYEPITIQPPRTAIGGGHAGTHGAGWKGVRTWCQQEAVGENITNITRNVDLLIIQVDADVCHDIEVNIIEACPPPDAGVDVVRDLILDWIGVHDVPEKVVLCVPAMASETWALVALFPDEPEVLPCDPYPVDAECVECNLGIKSILRRLSRNSPPKLVVSQQGRLKNLANGYRTTQNKLTHGWSGVVEVCSQADFFDQELRAILNF